MKTALTPDGKRTQASADAPAQAACPYCGGIVLLRGRRVMGSDQKSYYWRHTANGDLKCPGRSRNAQLTANSVIASRLLAVQV